MTSRVALAGVVAVALAASQAGAAIVISSWHVVTTATDNDNADVEAADESGVLPFSLSHTVSPVGGSDTSASYSLSPGGSFHVDYELHRSGSVASSSSVAGDIFFRVTEISSFDAGGFLSMEGFGRSRLSVKLWEGFSGSFFYRSFQSTENAPTPDEEFGIGGLDGNFENILIGSLPVTLFPGEFYAMSFNATIQNSVADSGANAMGSISMSVSPGGGGGAAGVIPAPNAAILAVIGLGLIRGFGRRRP